MTLIADKTTPEFLLKILEKILSKIFSACLEFSGWNFATASKMIV